MNYRDRFSRLNVFHSKCKRTRFEYKFFSKSRSFRGFFNSSIFKHVNFKGSIMTSCTFSKSTLYGVEFLGSNLKQTSFKGTNFERVIFVGANLTDCNFRGAKFTDTIFVNTNIKKAKYLDANIPGIRIINKYPTLNISDSLYKAINETRKNPRILNYKVLHLGLNKLNNLNLYLLLEKFNEDDLIRGLYYAADNVRVNIYTLSCLEDFLLKYKHKYVKL